MGTTGRKGRGRGRGRTGRTF